MGLVVGLVVESDLHLLDGFHHDLTLEAACLPESSWSRGPGQLRGIHRRHAADDDRHRTALGWRDVPDHEESP